MSLREVYNRHCHTAEQERALLSAIGFTSTFTAARLITHSIRAGIGPFHNISAGGRHIHHSTFGIFGLLGIGYLWTYRIGIGDKMPEWESRLTASAYGVAAALTLDEFALWLDLHDDYWDKQGRKSIDAVAVFAGLLTIGVAGRDMINELGLFPKRISKLVERDQPRRAALRQAARRGPLGSASAGQDWMNASRSALIVVGLRWSACRAGSPRRSSASRSAASFADSGPGVGVGDDLVVVAVHDQDRHA